MKRIFTLLCLFCFVQNGMAQKKAEEALQYFQEHYPLEKVFIQYNKEHYVAGEKMWFKCYVFSEYTFSSQSTNLYVELYNQQKEILDKSIIPLLNGAGEGSFSLSQQMDEGVYYIRAYTTWMLNYDENFPYLHQFLVYNSQSPRQIKAKPIRWNAKAFAESGQLIAGMENQMAVRLFSETLLPSGWRGVVRERDDPSIEVAQFSSLNEEVGAFRFTPQYGKSYVAVISDAIGNEKTIALPQVQASGIVLKTQQEADSMVCKVYFKDVDTRGRKFKLIGQMQNQLVCKVNLINPDSVMVVKLPAHALTDGIIHFTLFDSNEQPLTERLSFFHAGKVMAPPLALDTLSFRQRARNVWRINVDSFAFFTYSMLIVDANTTRPRENWLSSLLLSNDIGYKPANPAWYFNADSPVRKTALDALLLTEKWRWFTWQNLLAGRYPGKEYKEGAYLSFTGTVFKGRKLQLNQNINLVFQYKDSSVAFQQVSTDSSGSFQMDGAVFEDTIKVYYKMNTKKTPTQNFKILFEHNNQFQRLKASLPTSPYFLATRSTGDTISAALRRSLTAYENQLAVNNKYKSLQEVVVKAKRASATEQLNKSLSSGLFQSSDERVFDFVNEDQHAQAYANIIDWIRARVPGTIAAGEVFRNMIYIDEMAMTMQEALTLPISEVAMVKIFRNIWSSSMLRSGYGYTIAIYTRRGYKNHSVGLVQGLLVGYKKPEKYVPFNYDEDGFEVVKHDVRDVLCWNTFLPEYKGDAVVPFYNNDSAKVYRVIIMGFSAKGQPIYLEREIMPDNNNVSQSNTSAKSN